MPATTLYPYKPQPLKDLVRERYLTYRAVAYAIGLVEKDGSVADSTVASLIHVANGRVYPSAIMLRELPRYFGVPLEEIFDDRMIAGSPHHAGRERRTGVAS